MTERRKSMRLQLKAEQEVVNPTEFTTPKKSSKSRKKRQLSKTTANDIENDSSADEQENIETHNDKPTELFSDNDVDGRQMHPVISNNIKKSAMLERAKASRNLYETANTPVKTVPCLVLKKIDNEGHANKEKWNSKLKDGSNKNKTELRYKRKPQYNTSDDSSCDERTTSGSSEDENSVNDDKENEETKESKNEEIDLPRLRSGRVKASRDYTLKADEYFAKQSEKSITSNHTLSRLKNRHIDEKELQELLAKSLHISQDHKEKIHLLSKTVEKRYEEWLHIMEEGFSVLLYGLGSKRLLINNFFKKVIPEEPTLIINGFFPSLTIKEILDNIIIELLGLEPSTNQNECFDIIEKTMKANPKDRMYLLIHNIDGGMLRSSKAQDILSRLAKISNIHVLASADHINAPLIWDNVKRARYNFYWVNATSFLPYEAETSYESSLLVQKSGALALLSLQNVFASLTSNAKNIYLTLVKYQIENNGKNYAGMAFRDLHAACREAFLASSDQALRSQLNEFSDHKLLKTRRNVDGTECLIIPLDDALLKQFLEQQNEAA